MSEIQPSRRGWRLKPWQTILLFGVLQWLLYGIGSFTLDYYAGQATRSFFVWPEPGGIGMYFVYILSFYITLLVILPILLIRRFGVGLAIYLPYAVTGFFIDYYFDWVVFRILVSPWGALGWCVIGLLIGLSADLAYRYLPHRMSERWRAILTGVVMGVVNFFLVVVALTFFYIDRPTGPGSFLGIAYYALPLMLLNSGFGGYAAYAISKKI
jgi:hypothetical protein